MRVMRFIKTKYIVRLLLLALVTFAIPATAPTASAAFGIGISVGFAPPALPIYSQPLCPGDGYIWTPGYWAYADSGYYWVPGVWVLPPQIGFLWTPGYWGWGGGGYFWHGGYWGPHIGFYGGVNYGFGYFGHGYEGGYWNHNHFYYNRSVNNVNINNIHNTYNRSVSYNRDNRVSYNGGRGGINARPTSGEMAANRDRHFEATGAQHQQEHFASTNRGQFASSNHGQPAVGATSRPGDFSNRNAATTRGNERSNGSGQLNSSRTANRDSFNRGSNNAASATNRNSGARSAGTFSQNNNQRDNSFARSQNNATRAQGNTSRQSAIQQQQPSVQHSAQHAEPEQLTPVRLAPVDPGARAAQQRDASAVESGVPPEHLTAIVAGLARQCSAPAKQRRQVGVAEPVARRITRQQQRRVAQQRRKQQCQPRRPPLSGGRSSAATKKAPRYLERGAFLFRSNVAATFRWPNCPCSGRCSCC